MAAKPECPTKYDRLYDGFDGLCILWRFDVVHDELQLKQVGPYIEYHDSRLTEGITYNPANNSLLWVDIIKGEINRVFLKDDLSYSERESHKVDASLGVIGLTSDPDIYICGASSGVGQFNFSTKEFKLIAKYPAEFHDKEKFGKTMRSNDGAIDSNGDFWVGTMANFDEEVTPVGRLYKYDSKTLKEEVIIKDVAISNGINWFGDYMYWTSSLEYRIYRFKYDYKSGSIDPSTKEVFVDIPKIFHDRPQYHKGEPDG
ncbi:unnamed protein product [Ambrosiozyma monospora]|uniref:Unnamed protein product n=1 Tax=Ambrosiozyma monospora TaxID=43982 RepID=A0A9W6Z5J2_AMBMO|nr:unnamed protein product [Ambrosiozyma monospora]